MIKHLYNVVVIARL